MKSKSCMTLDRILSRLGLASRTEARAAIKAGRIKVNGGIERNPERWVRPGRDVVQLDGRRLRSARKVYLLFYKPKGVVTSHGDPDGRKTVYDCLATQCGAPRFAGALEDGSKLPQSKESVARVYDARPSRLPEPRYSNASWLAPVGRLDKDTSGLLLMTNDTEFANFVTSPESCIPKTYLVKLNALLDDATIVRLASGVRMKRGDQARPESVRRIEDRGKYTWLEIVLTEGKNREVRRMIEAVGSKVLKLVRTRIGPLSLEGLQPGQWRELRPGEISGVRIAGAPAPRRRTRGSQ